MISDAEVVRSLEDSPWERAQRQAAIEGAFLAAVVEVPCGWCGMFAALPGKTRCGICDESEGDGK